MSMGTVAVVHSATAEGQGLLTPCQNPLSTAWLPVPVQQINHMYSMFST